MKIRDIMRRPFTILDTDTLGTAERAMARWQIRHLPVVSGGRILGMLSQRDILAARAHADPDDDWWTIRVHDAMTQPVQTCGPDDSLTEVAGRLAASKIGALPVVEVGQVIGIVTVTDVLEGEVRAAMGPSAAARTIASDVMTPLPQTVTPESSLVDAVARMIGHRIRHLRSSTARAPSSGCCRSEMSGRGSAIRSRSPEASTTASVSCASRT